ncbi:hypothetical protein ACFXPX_20650 [Kitasatospora sp. NPDC059146]|uniref:hypothetical protein n=1 Tax=unclassified Kitasatospora TaxID=2633591 RepID=UPI0036B7BED3
MEELIRPVLGRQAWAVRLLLGSNLAMDFGSPVEPYGNGSVFGEWHLWVSMAAWRLEGGGRVIAGSEDPRSVLVPAVALLEDRRLMTVTIRPPALETVFEFDGIELHVFPIYSQRDVDDPADHWMLWMPAGDILTVGPGSTWSVETSSSRRGRRS